MRDIVLTRDYEKIISIWERSVRASHDFLTIDVILDIKSELIRQLPYLKIYAYEEAADEIVGFIAILTNRIEMLFVSPEHFRRGIGRALVDFAIDNMKVYEVDVNEQNNRAKVFYEHVGFSVACRMERDAGRNFPLLRMRKSL
ncbi:MAG: GNAT family N-acetyltransferase [Deferribacteraceae bacterium]|jgi:putative acetyltransferase|nr:GNAT family N-acetyltransferase [Deferribacteraceae bacterium]